MPSLKLGEGDGGAGLGVESINSNLGRQQSQEHSDCQTLAGSKTTNCCNIALVNWIGLYGCVHGRLEASYRYEQDSGLKYELVVESPQEGSQASKEDLAIAGHNVAQRGPQPCRHQRGPAV